MGDIFCGLRGVSVTQGNGSITRAEEQWQDEGALFPGSDPQRALKGGESNKAAETSAFEFRRLFQQPTFFLGVVGEHFRSKWGLAGAPRRNVIPFGHPNLWYFLTR
ncbi:MAG: hypothetical protein WBD93_15840 [Acidobacteriaceae bacterium]